MSHFKPNRVPKYLDDSGTEHDWPRFDTEQREYLEFRVGMTGDDVRHNLHTESKYFWEYVLPEIGGKVTHTETGNEQLSYLLIN